MGVELGVKRVADELRFGRFRWVHGTLKVGSEAMELDLMVRPNRDCLDMSLIPIDLMPMA